MPLLEIPDLQELRYLVQYLKANLGPIPHEVAGGLSNLEAALHQASSEVPTAVQSSFGHPELRYPTPSSPLHPGNAGGLSSPSHVGSDSASPAARFSTPSPDAVLHDAPASVASGTPAAYSASPDSRSSVDVQSFDFPVNIEGDPLGRDLCQEGRSSHSEIPVPQSGVQAHMETMCVSDEQEGVNGDGSQDRGGKKSGRGGKKGVGISRGAGFAAKESLLGNTHGMNLRRRKEGGVVQAAGGVDPGKGDGGPNKCCRGGTKAPPKAKSHRQRDEALLEQEFRQATTPQGYSSEPESPPLSEDAHHLVLELSYACHRFLSGSHSNDPDHPVMKLVELLTNNDSSHLAAQAAARLESAFAQDSLENLAMRCSIADQNIATNFFALMLNMIQLRCGVIRRCFLRNAKKNAVIKEIEYKASVFILVFVAAANLQTTIRHLTHDTILRVYWLLRSPNPDHVLGKLVIQDIIPAVRELQRRCRIKFSTMFSESLLFEKGIPPFSEAGDLTRSDEFFDRITFNAILKPRHKGYWLPCLQGSDIPITESPFHVVNKAILSANSLSLKTSIPVRCDYTMDPGSPLTPIDDGSCDYEVAAEHFQGPERKAKTLVIDTNFDPDLEANQQTDFTKRGDKDFCFKVTERERYLAGKAEVPSSLDDLKARLQKQLSGGFKESGAYINVTQDCADGTRIRVNDKNGNVVMFMFPDLPEEKRSRLMLALKATFPGEVKHTDSEKEGASFSFPARQFHFWNVYATHGSQYPDDVEPSVSLKNKASKKGKSNATTCMPRASEEILKESKRYWLLKECLADIFDWIRAVLKEALPEEFELISGYARVLPADGFSPVYPFSGFVLNINVCTKMHRDARDLRLCLVMALSDANCVGGDICFKEPGIRLQLRCGDMVAFPSSRLTHFNRHFNGERASLVFHTDANGQVWLESFNHWEGNVYMNTTRVF